MNTLLELGKTFIHRFTLINNSRRKYIKKKGKQKKWKKINDLMKESFSLNLKYLADFFLIKISSKKSHQKEILVSFWNKNKSFT